MKSLKGKILAVLASLFMVGAGYALGAGVTFAPRTSLAAPVLLSQDTITAIYENASPAVVEIQTSQRGSGFGGRSFQQQGQGSGFLIDAQGRILTNNHVVDGASTVEVVLQDGNTVEAKVLGKDSTNDLALIGIDPSSVSGIAPLQFADSSAVKPGQIAIALGSPFGLNDSITVGVVSGLNRSLRGGRMTGMLQTDAAINPGNSGGPLLDANGQVIGINTAIETGGGGARGVGFAVASNVARKQLSDLIAGRQATRPFLGISGTALTRSLATELGLSVNRGVYVISVVPDGPADKAGLKGASRSAGGQATPGGDVITAVDGKAVTSVEDLSAYFNASKMVGDSVSLTVLRGANSLTVTATLAAFPETSTDVRPLPNPNRGPLPNIPLPPGWRFEWEIP
ncbi:MAG: trypsin-like peptidase domain-containing protein [Chloroflexi bacterium]|nr:trypsin-like peptidase domain-containing protein [Chloroflexota bacterium]